jgi:hypothetical protein
MRMNVPIDDGDFEDRLKYAPAWARRSASKEDAEPHTAEPAKEPPREIERAADPGERDLPDAGRPTVADGPTMAPDAIDQPDVWLRAPARVFEGDRAVRELRTRMALEPHLVPEPPQPSPHRSVLGRLIRFAAIIGFAAGAAYLVVLFGFPDQTTTVEKADGAPKSTLASKETDRAASLLQSQASPVRLALVESHRATVNESVPLGVTLTSEFDDGAVIVNGLAEGAQLSTGFALEGGSWRVPLADLAQTNLVPPRDFVGVMQLTVELYSADGAAMDKSTMQIEWTPALNAASASAPAQPGSDQTPRSEVSPVESGNLTLDPEEIATLVKRGEDFIANGDLASARLVLRRAAEGGDAQAALLLGSTYDPATFERLKVLGSAPDPVQARAWYQRAADLGSAEAVRRLEPLALGAR